MNIKEIYVLNTALDGRQIFYLPDFEKLHLSDLLLEDVKEGMVENGLLESSSSLTIEGVKITKRMEDFKKARKYIKLGSLVIGIADEKRGVLLKHIPEYEEYYFERIDMTDGLINITKSYPFLIETNNFSCNSEPEKLTIEEVEKKFNPDIDNCVFLSTIDLKDVKLMSEVRKTNEMIFAFEGNLYLYDRNAELLFIKDTDEIQKLIKERITA